MMAGPSAGMHRRGSGGPRHPCGEDLLCFYLFFVIFLFEKGTCCGLWRNLLYSGRGTYEHILRRKEVNLCLMCRDLLCSKEGLTLNVGGGGT